MYQSYTKRIMGSTDNDDTSHYEGAVLEDIQHKLKQIAEGVSGLTVKVDGVDKRVSKVEQQTELIPSIKAAVTDQTKQLNDHDARIADLEKTTA